MVSVEFELQIIFFLFRIYTATWNVNNFVPAEIFLSEWLAKTESAPDIYAIAFQEIDMSPQCIMINEQRPDRLWVEKIIEGLHPSAKYEELITVRLVGMQLIIAIKSTLRKCVRHCSSDIVGTGPLNMVSARTFFFSKVASFVVF
jgi:inositol polyphosphate 5-phosphatase INPP5B/F